MATSRPLRKLRQVIHFTPFRLTRQTVRRRHPGAAQKPSPGNQLSVPAFSWPDCVMRNVQIVDCPDGNYRYAAIDRQTGDFLLRLSDRAALLALCKRLDWACMSSRSRERRAERVSSTRRSEGVNSVGAGVNTELVAPPSTPPPIVAAWLAWAFDGPSTKVAVRESRADLGCDGAALAMASTRADQSHCGAGRLLPFSRCRGSFSRTRATSYLSSCSSLQLTVACPVRWTHLLSKILTS